MHVNQSHLVSIPKSKNWYHMTLIALRRHG